MDSRFYSAVRAQQQVREGEKGVIECSPINRIAERNAQSAVLLTELLEVLPAPKQMAEILSAAYAQRQAADGMTPEVTALGESAGQIEWLLSVCRAHAISTDACSVEEAIGVLGRVTKEAPELPAEVIPGDHINCNFIGAMLVAKYPNDSRWELSLRRSHSDYEDMEEGLWLLEGGGFMSSGERPCVEVHFGKILPQDIQTIIAAHAVELHKSSSACLHALRGHGD